jgi:hypothetical protein
MPPGAAGPQPLASIRLYPACGLKYTESRLTSSSERLRPNSRATASAGPLASGLRRPLPVNPPWCVPKRPGYRRPAGFLVWYLPRRLGLGGFSRAYTSAIHEFRVPNTCCQYPERASGQFRAIRVCFPWPTGRRQSLSSWVAHGLSVPLLVWLGLPLDSHSQTTVSDPRNQRPSQRAQDLGPLESQHTQGHSLDCPASPASSRLHNHWQPGPRPARRPPLHCWVRPGPIMTQAHASATGATGALVHKKLA